MIRTNLRPPQALGLPYGDARMRHVMIKYDADHSGSIGLEEFFHYMSVGLTTYIRTFLHKLRPLASVAFRPFPCDVTPVATISGCNLAPL